MKLVVDEARCLEFLVPWFLAEGFLAFIQAAWRMRAVGSTSSASVVRRGGGGTAKLTDRGNAKRALGDRHGTRAIIGYYSGDLHTKEFGLHEPEPCPVASSP
jgi:hypothetical protein